MYLTEEKGQYEHPEQIKEKIIFLSEVIFITSVCFNVLSQRGQPTDVFFFQSKVSP